MSRYGIKLVWAGWENDQLIGFNNRVKKKWEAQIGPGVKMLIYETSMKRPGYTGRGGIRSIIGEVEATQTRRYPHPLASSAADYWCRNISSPGSSVETLNRSTISCLIS